MKSESDDVLRELKEEGERIDRWTLRFVAMILGALALIFAYEHGRYVGAKEEQAKQGSFHNPAPIPAEFLEKLRPKSIFEK